jgi:hypothetical protein
MTAKLLLEQMPEHTLASLLTIMAAVTARSSGAAMLLLAQVDEAQVDEAQVDEAQVDEAQVDEAQVDEAQVDKAQVDEAQVDKAQVDEAQVDKAQVDEAQVDEALPSLFPARKLAGGQSEQTLIHPRGQQQGEDFNNPCMTQALCDKRWQG